MKIRGLYPRDGSHHSVSRDNDQSDAAHVLNMKIAADAEKVKQ